MKLSTLTPREQLIALLVAIALVTFVYGFFRFMPQQKALASLEADIQKTQSRLYKARVPDEPTEGLDSLIKQLEDQEKTLKLLQQMSQQVKQSLAPEGSQELKVLISRLARDYRIRIKKNETFTPPSLMLNKPVNRLKKRPSKKNRKRSAKVNTQNPLPATYSWVQRMAPGTPFYRPLQRLVLHCDYPSLRRFVHDLSDLPWQVTIVQMKIEKLPTQPLRGTTQQLQTELILAL